MGILKYGLLPFGPPGWLGFYLIRRGEKRDEARRLETLKEASSYNPQPIYWQQWATDAMLRETGRFRKEGLLVGLTVDSNIPIFGGVTSPNRISGGTTSGGKTSTAAAATVDDSMTGTSLFIPEVAPELSYMTANFRRRCGEVFRIDPYDIARIPGVKRAFYDVVRLEWLNPVSPYFFARSAKISSLAISKGSGRESPYWSLKSRAGFQGALMAVRKYCDPKLVDFPFVARIVSDDLPAFAKYIVRRCDDPVIRSLLVPWANPRGEDIRSLNEVIENLRAELAWARDPAVMEVLSGSANFSPTAMRRSVQTVYPVFPGELLDGPVAKFLSFLTGCFFAETMRYDPFARTRVQAILDELFVLDLPDLPRLFATSRRFGVAIWGLVQDFSELRQMTERTFSTVLGNAGTLQVMGVAPGNHEDASFVSAILGDTEVWAYNKSVSYHQTQFNIAPFSGNSDRFEPSRIPEWRELQHLHVSQSYSQQRRRFMTEAEVTALDRSLQICWLEGVSRPVLCKKAPYFKTAARYRIQNNPMLRGK